MDAISPTVFITIQPRPVIGWPLRRLCDLDAASPHFLSHVLTASALKRQVVFAAVAETQHDLATIARALGAASGIQCRDPLAQAARSLVLLKPAEILKAIYRGVPDGLLGALKRVGPDPFARRGLYRDFFRLFADPEERERANLIRQFTGKISEERVEIALALDVALLHQRAFAHVTDLDEAEQVNAAVRLIRATVSSATTAQLLQSLAVLPQGVELSEWGAMWLRKIDRPLAPPPTLNDPDLVVIGIAELRAASREFRNCLKERVPHVATARDCYVVSITSSAVAELRSTSNGTWVVAQIWGRGNERPSQAVADEMRGKLEAAGVHSLSAGVSDADLESLAEFFSAFDLLWALPRRARLPGRLGAPLSAFP